jgi:hypothetical protein
MKNLVIGYYWKEFDTHRIQTATRKNIICDEFVNTFIDVLYRVHVPFHHLPHLFHDLFHYHQQQQGQHLCQQFSSMKLYHLLTMHLSLSFLAVSTLE